MKLHAHTRVGLPIRTTVNAFDEPRFAKAVEATGRKKLIIAGVSTEVCLAFPAIHATAIGYDAYALNAYLFNQPDQRRTRNRRRFR